MIMGYERGVVEEEEEMKEKEGKKIMMMMVMMMEKCQYIISNVWIVYEVQYTRIMKNKIKQYEKCLLVSITCIRRTGVLTGSLFVCLFREILVMVVSGLMSFK